MKKIIIVFLAVIVGLTFWMVIKQRRFNPLSQREYESLFSEFGDIKMLYGEDAVKIDLHGDIIDYYIFQTDHCVIDSSFPDNLDNWGSHQLDSMCRLIKWTKNSPDIPVEISKKWNEVSDNFTNNRRKKEFSNALKDTCNYISYIQCNELNYYLFIFCPQNGLFFYHRLDL